MANDSIACEIPSTQEVVDALRQHPNEVDYAAQTAVEFFYTKVLITVNANISSKEVWTANNSYVDILKGDWATFYATAHILLQQYSNIDNILANTSSDSSDEDGSKKKTRKSRARLMDAKARRSLANNFYKAVKIYKGLLTEEAKPRMRAWDALYSPAKASRDKLGAKDRQTVAPVEHQATDEAEVENSMQDFFKESGDFDFLAQTGPGGAWGQATAAVQQERQKAIDGTPSYAA